MYTKAVGIVLKKYREEKGVSQEVLSGLACVDRSHLSKIELGKRSPSVNIFLRISVALNVKPHIIMQEIEKILEE